MSTTGNKGTAAAKAAAIEARVQQLQAGLRVERDKARRAYELAAERLGLLRDEVANAEQLVQERQEMLVKLATETSALEEQTSLGDEVTRWKQQADFQHSELVAKRQKKTEMDHALRVAAETRQQTLQDIDHEVNCRTLEKRNVADRVGVWMVPNPQVVEDEWQDEETRMLGALPGLVEDKHNLYQQDTKRLQEENSWLRFFLERLEDKFGAHIMVVATHD